jgi:ATP-binding cassette subfamily F protein uup
MNYLSVENISKSYGERVLFDNVSFGINKDQKIAFIAKNGSGKTTIMNMINGLDEPDNGQVVIRKEINMAFLSQNNNLQDELTIEENIFASTRGLLLLTFLIVPSITPALKKSKFVLFNPKWT